jgi:RNA polymerase sigma-70 factor (ECF subfamily)
VDERGELVLLEEQDRSLWHAGEIDEGIRLVEFSGCDGPFAIQAAIAAEHVADSTDWSRVAALYGRLAAFERSPVVELNRAVAVAMAEGPEAGLDLIEPLADGRLEGYHLLHATRADLLRRLGRAADAAAAYRRAAELTGNPTERAFLERRLSELSG